MKRLTLIALNEFNVDFFREGCSIAPLPNIERVLSMAHSQTATDDRIERKGLDPWVQWVSIHTGTPSSVHGIRHLGDVPKLATTQVWEQLGADGISSGIWGAMNASRNQTSACEFFLPDPWTYSEQAYPAELNRLLALPRYYSKNYLETSKSELLFAMARLVGFLLSKPVMTLQMMKTLPTAFRGIFRFGLKNHMLFSLFDLASAAIFKYYKGKKDTAFNLVFMNSIAHVQHNVWSRESTIDPPCLYALETIDQALGIILSTVKEGEALIVMNALSQRRLAADQKEILYRQINPRRFLESIEIRFASVEQMMTNDGHILFHSLDDAQQALKDLSECTMNGTRIFDVEYNEATPRQLFFQLDFWHPVSESSEFVFRGKPYRFMDHFEAVVERTGEHVAEGDVFSQGIDIPEHLYNHEIQHHVLDYFDSYRTGSIDDVADDTPDSTTMVRSA